MERSDIQQLTKKQIETLTKLSRVLPRMEQHDADRFVGFCEGLVFRVRMQTEKDFDLKEETTKLAASF